MNLTGKWKYYESYTYGVAEGELYLEQDGMQLSGRIVFSDRLRDGDSYMIQEFLQGEVDERKVRLEAKEFDIIHSEYTISYELDSWFGVLVEDEIIKGVSVDDQGVEGYFVFEKMKEA